MNEQQPNPNFGAFTTRHSTPARKETVEDPRSSDYKDLTVSGVEQAKEKAKTDIAKLVENAPAGAIIYIGGVSDQPRTRQTAIIYGNALSEIQDQLGDTLVLTKSEIDEMTSKIKTIKDKIRENPDKKIVVDFPLMLKQLTYKYNERWTDKQGNTTEYFTAILAKHNNDSLVAAEDWFKNAGKLKVDDREIQGPTPQQVAEDYLEGLKRLNEFASKIAPDRPVIVSEIGHQWDLDALVTYLANNGKVDLDGFKRVSQEQGISKETEMSTVSISDGKATVNYRGQEFISVLE